MYPSLGHPGSCLSPDRDQWKARCGPCRSRGVPWSPLNLAQGPLLRIPPRSGHAAFPQTSDTSVRSRQTSYQKCIPPAPWNLHASRSDESAARIPCYGANLGLSRNRFWPPLRVPQSQRMLHPLEQVTQRFTFVRSRRRTCRSHSLESLCLLIQLSARGARPH